MALHNASFQTAQNRNTSERRDQRLTAVYHYKLHTKFEQLPMFLGHMTLNELNAILQKGSARNRVTGILHLH